MNLLRRLHDHADDVLRFFADPRAPFDNHQAARDIRMPELKQEASGAFTHQRRCGHFLYHRSYLATLRSRDPFESLVLASPPSLSSLAEGAEQLQKQLTW